MDNLMKNYNLNDLFSDVPKVKYGCAKKLRSLAVENPKELYPSFDFFVELLDSDNKIIKWTALDIIGFLSFVDSAKKIDSILDEIIGFLSAGNLITANHATESLINICIAKPHFSEKIIDNLIKIDRYTFDTDECRNIAIGKVILGLDLLLDKIKNNPDVLDFVQRGTYNSRNATKKKAEKLLKKI